MFNTKVNVSKNNEKKSSKLTLYSETASSEKEVDLRLKKRSPVDCRCPGIGRGCHLHGCRVGVMWWLRVKVFE